MNMISGIYHPDGGTIYVDGKVASIQSPLDAQKFGIGMIHQHFKLVNIFSAMENIELGTPGKKLPPKVLKQEYSNCAKNTVWKPIPKSRSTP